MEKEVKRMTYGVWSDYFHAYKEIYNFETKKLIYKDIEDEQKEFRKNHPELEPVGE